MRISSKAVNLSVEYLSTPSTVSFMNVPVIRRSLNIGSLHNLNSNYVTAKALQRHLGTNRRTDHDS